MGNSDQQTTKLLDLAASGSDSAISQLLIANRPRLRRMVYVRLHDGLKRRVDPSDVVQDVMAEAVARFPTYLESRPIPFYLWLRRLAWDKLVRLHERHVLAQKRSVRREVYGCFNLSSESVLHLADRFTAATPSQISKRNEVRRRVHEALEQLSEGDREFLALKYLESMTIPEVAATLEISTSAAKSRHLRALKRLNDRIAGLSREDLT